MSAKRPTMPVGERFRRLLVMLPWLMERGEVPVSEAVERFGISEAELVRDLELVAMCGLPPFVDELIDVFVDEGMIFTGVPRLFTKSLRLTAPEGFALVAAGRAAMQLPGADADGALGRALEKLAAALGGDVTTVEVDQPAALDALTAAAERGSGVNISYWSQSSDEVTTRLIWPRHVLLDRGRWYVRALDNRSGELRTFRVDRIEEWSSDDEARPAASVSDDLPPVEADGSWEWFADAELPLVTLRVDQTVRWVIESVPTRSLTDDGSTVVAELVVASERWLSTLLVQLGPRATVVEPASWRGRGAARAAAMLAAYEATGS